ncbi:MAG: hypothetical protein CMI31_02745 [Opitutae bacterium]|nr:hypothetical protein [Opitutae bacterium]
MLLFSAPRMKRFFSLGLISLLLPCLTMAQTEAPQGLISEAWMEVRMFNAKVGYSHTTLRRDGDVVHTRTETTMIINRAGADVTMKSIESSRETIGGKPLGFFTSMDLGSAPVRKKGVFADGKIRVTAKQFGREKVTEYNLDQRGIMSWGLELLSRTKGNAKGTKYEAWMYSPEFGMDAPTKVTVESHGEEQFELKGKTMKGTKLVSTMHSEAGEVPIATWLGEDGRPLRVTMQMAGIPIEMIATDRALAKAEFQPTDLFTQSLLSIETEIPGDANSVVYRMLPKKDKQLDLQPEKNDFQQVRSLGEGGVEVTVKRARHADLLKAKGHSGGLAFEYKKANVMIDSDDPLVQRLAKGATQGSRNVFDMAHRLRHFVSHYVRVKNLEVGFATASEVARSREGDCSEHAVLLAAMGRAAGLPSRVVAGLVYVPELAGKKNVMGYHLWTQFHLRGRWVDFDAALGESECAPTRICLMTSSLEDSSLTELGLALLDYIGQVEIKVTKVE